jgi:O-antigen/teichoic acid export membrane protein
LIDKLSKFGKAIKKIRELGLIGLADISGSAIAALFWFILAAIVGVHDYGQIGYFLAISGIVAYLSLAGASNTLFVYTSKGIKIKSSVFFLSLILCAASSTILYFVFNKIELSVLVIGYVIFNLAISELLGMKEYKKYAKYVISQKILMLGLSIGLYFVYEMNGVLLGIGLSYFPYILRIFHAFRHETIDFSVIKSKGSFIINSYVLDLSNAFLSSIDKLIIAPLFGFIVLGNYQLAVQFLAILYIIPNVFYKFILPRESSGIPTNLAKRFAILISIGLASIGLIASPFVIPVLFPKFADTVTILQMISLAVIPNTINLLFVLKFLSLEKIRIVLGGSLVYIAAQISGILILGTMYGVTGIAVSLVLSETVQTAYYLIVMRILRTNGK